MKRNVQFLASKRDSNGNMHWSVAEFDNVTRCMKYFNDLIFKADDLATW